MRTMRMNLSPDVQEQTKTSTKTAEKRKIVLFNDDVNTFDFVIDSLVRICGHDEIQAEQCNTLVHYKGKCDVKHGEYPLLEPMCTALLDRGLTAEIH